MSVYSGFSTRVQESKYGKLCEMLIGLLSNKILRTFKGENTNEIQFSRQLTSIYSKMLKLETFKYLPPKFSFACNELAEYGVSNFDSPQVSSFSEGNPSPRVIKTFSPISAHRLEQIDEENFKPFKKKIVFNQEKTSQPAENNFKANDFNASNYYEKVMEKYIKLSNKYAPKHDRSFSVGNKDPDLLFKDGIMFKS